jgi:quercetin dioxygenase-like cupin family protein
MIIQEVLSQLEITKHPVAKLLHKMEHGKILVLAFKAGMQLKDHRTPFLSLLLVLNGRVEFKQGDVVTTMRKYDEMQIYPEVIHAVTCWEDALCLLFQG